MAVFFAPPLDVEQGLSLLVPQLLEQPDQLDQEETLQSRGQAWVLHGRCSANGHALPPWALRLVALSPALHRTKAAWHASRHSVWPFFSVTFSPGDCVPSTKARLCSLCINQKVRFRKQISPPIERPQTTKKAGVAEIAGEKGEEGRRRQHLPVNDGRCHRASTH